MFDTNLFKKGLSPDDFVKKQTGDAHGSVDFIDSSSESEAKSLHSPVRQTSMSRLKIARDSQMSQS
jgi:hypothetical protein